MDQNEGGGRKLVIGIVIIIVIVVIAAIWLSLRNPADDNTAAVGGAFDREAALEVGKAANLTVNDQLPGGVVYVAQVELPGGGWVVIKKLENNIPGGVIGAGYFAPTSRVGNVDLIETTVEGEKYVVELYADNGDERFSLVEDVQLLNASGQPIMTTFTATKDLPEIKG